MPNQLQLTLHTLNKTAQESTINLKLSQTIQDGDSVILIEDGVYQCLGLFIENTQRNYLTWPQQAKNIYALEADASARGIPLSIEGVIFITYEKFVELSLAHRKVVSWY